MSALCLCYEVHEPYRLRRYTVFDMGQNSMYEDDDSNCDILLHTARTCYLPMNDLLLRLIRRYGKDFKVSFSISGTTLDQFEQYAPEVLESFQALADTGCVEFIAETAAHSLALLYSKEEFARQTKEQAERIKRLFGKKPTTFRNTELIYSNELPQALKKLGFKTVLAEGAEHVLGWRSANYLYSPAGQPEMRLLLRNCSLSSDIGLRFSQQSWDQWPLSAPRYAQWCHSLADQAEVINIFNDYHAFGLRHKAESGIFQFMEALPDALLAQNGMCFMTPSEVSRELQPVGEIDVPQFMSWDDEGRDLTAWLGNDMQKDAIHFLYSLTGRVRKLNLPDLNRDFERLQTSDHFQYISTKWFAEYLPDRPNPFGNPYDAYITYMNVLADFEMRLCAAEEARARRQKEARARRAADREKGPAAGAGQQKASAAVRTPAATMTAELPDNQSTAQSPEQAQPQARKRATAQKKEQTHKKARSQVQDQTQGQEQKPTRARRTARKKA